MREAREKSTMAPCSRRFPRFVERDTAVDAVDIDLESKNKFRWDWLLLKDDSGDFFSDYFRKIEKDGFAWCCFCKCEIKYGSGGVRCLKDHANRSKAHERNRRIFRSNHSLPAAMQAVCSKISGTADINTNSHSLPRPSSSSSSLPYGAAPNIEQEQSRSRIDLEVASVPKPVSFKDRVTHQESLICSYLAEHTLSLSMAPHLIELAQELASDGAALKKLHMERQTATYKLRHGLSALEHVRLVSFMKNNPFSINIDESTSKACKKRILNILVCYFCEKSQKCVCHLYASIQMSVVNASTVFEAVLGKFRQDEIPLSNLVSVLSDSAAYMRGSLNGFHAKLREVAPHILDIDGDVCHHVHNTVKKFVSIVDDDMLLVKLLDDLFNDFDFSADLRDDLKEICGFLNITEQVPLQRAGHRWMSVFDAASRYLELQKAVTLFYSSWLTVDEKKKYQPILTSLLINVQKESRLKIIGILQRLKKKNLTPAGKQRKGRIINKLFGSRQQTQLLANFVVSILPLFNR